MKICYGLGLFVLLAAGSIAEGKNVRSANRDLEETNVCPVNANSEYGLDTTTRKVFKNRNLVDPIATIGYGETEVSLEYTEDDCFNILCEVPEDIKYVKFLFGDDGLHNAWRTPYYFAGLTGCRKVSDVCEETSVVVQSIGQTKNVCDTKTINFGCSKAPSPAPAPSPDYFLDCTVYMNQQQYPSPIRIGPDVDVYDLENDPDHWCHSIHCETNDNMYLVKFYYGDGVKHNAWNYPYWIFGTGGCRKLATGTQVRVEARVGGPYPGTVVAEKTINVVPKTYDCPCFDADELAAAEDSLYEWSFNVGVFNDNVEYNVLDMKLTADWTTYYRVSERGGRQNCDAPNQHKQISDGEYQVCRALFFERASAFVKQEIEEAALAKQSSGSDTFSCPCWDELSRYDASRIRHQCTLRPGSYADDVYYAAYRFNAESAPPEYYAIQSPSYCRKTEVGVDRDARGIFQPHSGDSAECRLDVLTACDELMDQYFPDYYTVK